MTVSATLQGLTDWNALADPPADPGFWSQPVATITGAGIAALVAIAALVFNVWSTRKNIALTKRSLLTAETGVRAANINAEAAKSSATAANTSAGFAKTNSDSAQRSSLSAHSSASTAQQSLLEVQRSNVGVEKWRQREETFRTLRWASDNSVREESGTSLMGLGVLGALVTHTSLIQSEDETFMSEVNRVVRDAARSIVMSVILNSAAVVDDNDDEDIQNVRPPRNEDEDEGDESGDGILRRVLVGPKVRSAALVVIEIARLDGKLNEVSEFIRVMAAGQSSEIVVKEKDLFKEIGLEPALDVSFGRATPTQEPRQHARPSAQEPTWEQSPEVRLRPRVPTQEPRLSGPSIGGR